MKHRNNMDENEIGTIVVETATEIHKELGPGLLETVYEIILGRELEERGLKIKKTSAYIN